MNSGKVTIEDGTYSTGTDKDGKGNSVIEAFGDGQVTVTGGTFKGEKYGEKYYLLNKKDGSNAKIVVTGGTFYGQNPADGDPASGGDSFVAEGYKVNESEGDPKVYTVVSNAD